MPLSYLKLPKFLLIKSIVYSPTWSFAASIAVVSAKVKAFAPATLGYTSATVPTPLLIVSVISSNKLPIVVDSLAVPPVPAICATSVCSTGVTVILRCTVCTNCFMKPYAAIVAAFSLAAISNTAPV